MKRIVICDTGPLLHLSEANIIYLLRLAGEVIIPLVVAKEIEQIAHEITLPDWVQLKDLDATHSKMAAGWDLQIDAGESATIALTRKMESMLLILWQRNNTADVSWSATWLLQVWVNYQAWLRQIKSI